MNRFSVVYINNNNIFILKGNLQTANGQELKIGKIFASQLKVNPQYTVRLIDYKCESIILYSRYHRKVDSYFVENQLLVKQPFFVSFAETGPAFIQRMKMLN